jgi:hypothetical protein
VKNARYFRVRSVVVRWARHFVLMGFAVILSAGSLRGQQPIPKKPVRSPESESCKTNLNRIFDAIQEYRKEYNKWPELISDLHPDYISDLSRFLCPEKLRRGEQATEGLRLRRTPFEDPIPNDYAYEFKTKSYPLWAGLSSTEREYKLRQMEVVGSNVPIVRCMNHYGLGSNLFLSVGGNIFDQNGSDWESLFINDQVRIEQLLPPAIFSDFAPLPGRFTNGILPREPATDANLIDLSRHYTSDLSTPWLWRNEGISLSNLVRGTIQLPTVPVRFDVRGVIQLRSQNMKSPFPAHATGIRVARKGQFLHFLEGAVPGRKRAADTHASAIGRYKVRYSDGQSQEIAIRYGQDVLAWNDTSDDLTTQEAKLAWQGTNGTSRISLYHQRWPNPRADTEIASLDFISTLAEAAPFLIAITVEP